MNMIAVDDERLSLDGLLMAIHDAVPKENVKDFTKPREALEYIQEHPCEIAFLDIQMRGMSGIDLAKQIKLLYPDINIIFCTGYDEYMNEAFKMHASGYLMKPVEKEDILLELENLRRPVEVARNHRVFVQTFGKFEVFIDKNPVIFKYHKTKELLAYLIDQRGAWCSRGEITAALWADDEGMLNKQSYLDNLRADLFRTFKEAGCDDFLKKERGQISVIPEKIDCDYLDWINNKPSGIFAYRGEYMSQYSWAELTLGQLESSGKNHR